MTDRMEKRADRKKMSVMQTSVGQRNLENYQEELENELLLEHDVISAVSRVYFSIYSIDLVQNFYEEISGKRILLAEDGVICVDKLEKSEDSAYDLVLMDIQMPNMDGYKATQIIRRLPDKMKSGIPIIAMTANAFDEDRKKALAIGMDGHIPKPVDVDRIKETLASILKPIGK